MPVAIWLYLGLLDVTMLVPAEAFSRKWQQRGNGTATVTHHGLAEEGSIMQPGL
jgi:hypothetical protein